MCGLIVGLPDCLMICLVGFQFVGGSVVAGFCLFYLLCSVLFGVTCFVLFVWCCFVFLLLD